MTYFKWSSYEVECLLDSHPSNDVGDIVVMLALRCLVECPYFAPELHGHPDLRVNERIDSQYY